jgi:DNA-binding transcriptional ArsR family regulator
MPTEPDRRVIVLGPAAHELRRRIGPTAWVVLEEMLQRSSAGGGQVVAEVSIRSLGSSLGLAKDTVGRALRRLRELGAIEARQQRTSSGPFDAGSYRITVPAVCLSLDSAAAPSLLACCSSPRSRSFSFSFSVSCVCFVFVCASFVRSALPPS